MNILILIALIILFVYNARFNKCENPDCDNCPFPKCNKEDKQ